MPLDLAPPVRFDGDLCVNDPRCHVNLDLTPEQRGERDGLRYAASVLAEFRAKRPEHYPWPTHQESLDTCQSSDTPS